MRTNKVRVDATLVEADVGLSTDSGLLAVSQSGRSDRPRAVAHIKAVGAD
jgi:hypothetical protein